MQNSTHGTHRGSRAVARTGAAQEARVSSETLLQEYARTRDMKIRNELVVRHEGLVRYLANRFASGAAASTEDLIQVGYMGLISAIERYDPEVGGAFATYAAPTVVGVIKHYLRDCTWSIKAPRRLRELATRLRGVRDRMEQQLGRLPTVPEMAATAGVTEERLLLAMEVDQLYRPASLDASFPEDPGSEGASYHEAFGKDDPQLSTVDLREALRNALSLLEEPERTVIYGRFFDEATQAQVATRLGVSQMQVSRLERRALQRLKAILS